MSTDNLNDIPLELRPLAPFLQRAQELKQKDPTMSYWCTFYAVQQGVHLKPRDKESRNYLLKIMAPLEVIRKNPNGVVVANNDACAYVEDFALRVFDAADNEDRRGDATRGTAKKFLAAANFLELLKVFEDDAQAEPSSSSRAAVAFTQHREKIRYAKWKAADIAKAFREGRKPAPGPAHAPPSVTSPGPEQHTGSTAVGFPRDASTLSAPSALYGRGPSPSGHSSATVSPVPGQSRNHSVSPGQRHLVLPFTSPADHRRDGPGVNPGANGSYFAGVRPNGIHSPSQATSPTVTTPPRPLGHPRPRSASQSQADVPFGFSRPPIPPRDVLSLHHPARPVLPTQPLPGTTTTPNPSGLYATPQKSPGTWSTVATPGGYDDLARRSGGIPPTTGLGLVEQASPSRVPENMAVVLAKQSDEPESASYPPRPYPAVRLSPPGANRNMSFTSNASTVGTPNRQETFSTSPHPPSTPTEGYYNNKFSQKREEEKKNAAEAAENDDLGPLAAAKPGQKRVRWTASVAGGSTVGSTSPGNSPKASSPPPPLPTLPDSSDSSSGGGDVKFPNEVKFGISGRLPTGSSPPTSVEDFQTTKPPVNGIKDAPPVPKKPQFISHTPSNSQSSFTNYTPAPPPATVSKALPTSTSSPIFNSSPRLAKNSPRNSPRTKFSDLPIQQTPTPSGTPHGSGFIHQPPAQFPGTASTPPVPSPAGTTTSLPSTNGPRLRRVSASAAPGTSISSIMNGQPSFIKPFVPLFGTTSSGLPTPTSSSFNDRNSPRASPTPPQSGTPTRALSPVNGKALPTSLPFRQIAAAKKHSKFASSALEFDDLETARQELIAALAILNGEKIE